MAFRAALLEPGLTGPRRSYDSGIISSVISDSYTEFHDYFHKPNASVLGAVVSAFAGGAFCERLYWRPHSLAFAQG